MTRLAAAIMVHGLDQALSEAARAAEFGADLVEFRIDRFTDAHADPSEVGRLVVRSPLPCILTCRPTWEGGEYDGDDRLRLSLFEHAAAGSRRPAYVDIELAAYERSDEVRRRLAPIVDQTGPDRSADTGLILSTHDFEKRPADLLRKIKAMAEVPACRVIKVAWRARSLRDNLEAFEIIQHHYGPTIALCMGEFGLPSRVLAKKFGALLTFAALDRDTGTAPGQPTLAQLRDLYRWDRIQRDTEVFGVIGYPVGHSMGPLIHNAGFDAVGFNGVYLPMSIPPEFEHFKATVGSWLASDPLRFRGASVTIPHKMNLLRFVAEQNGRIEPLARTIGAANTLTIAPDGGLVATNTDYGGALDAVCDGLGIERADLKSRRVAVLGAGGAGAAIVAGFARCGADVVIYNRTPEKARALVDRNNDDESTPGTVESADLSEVDGARCDVFINCTPIGMFPNVDQVPDRPRDWGPGTAVFDTIYNPIQTRLLSEARAAGCVTISGREMFLRQAVAQFEGWTRKTAPIELMRSVLDRTLAGRGDG